MNAFWVACKHDLGWLNPKNSSILLALVYDGRLWIFILASKMDASLCQHTMVYDCLWPLRNGSGDQFFVFCRHTDDHWKTLQNPQSNNRWERKEEWKKNVLDATLIISCCYLNWRCRRQWEMKATTSIKINLFIACLFFHTINDELKLVLIDW